MRKIRNRWNLQPKTLPLVNGDTLSCWWSRWSRWCHLGPWLLARRGHWRWCGTVALDLGAHLPSQHLADHDEIGEEREDGMPKAGGEVLLENEVSCEGRTVPSNGCSKQEQGLAFDNGTRDQRQRYPRPSKMQHTIRRVLVLPNVLRPELLET